MAVHYLASSQIRLNEYVGLNVSNGHMIDIT